MDDAAPATTFIKGAELNPTTPGGPRLAPHMISDIQHARARANFRNFEESREKLQIPAGLRGSRSPSDPLARVFLLCQPYLMRGLEVSCQRDAR